MVHFIKDQKIDQLRELIANVKVCASVKIDICTTNGYSFGVKNRRPNIKRI